ncbi:hypothetical protein SAMN04490239_9512 [Rhodococcus koreensis]|uniref:Uncharacterized protein n=1 Tax=Rhodococcus koreensis TaxID=99653 RepID=A0A1H5F621_9NOCA|nr:hypothetical protein SAMN04490239_9512 [Rhodococcus koreensis]
MSTRSPRAGPPHRCPAATRPRPATDLSHPGGQPLDEPHPIRAGSSTPENDIARPPSPHPRDQITRPPYRHRPGTRRAVESSRSIVHLAFAHPRIATGIRVGERSSHLIHHGRRPVVLVPPTHTPTPRHQQPVAELRRPTVGRRVSRCPCVTASSGAHAREGAPRQRYPSEACSWSRRRRLWRPSRWGSRRWPTSRCGGRCSLGAKQGVREGPEQQQHHAD